MSAPADTGMAGRPTSSTAVSSGPRPLSVVTALTLRRGPWAANTIPDARPLCAADHPPGVMPPRTCAPTIACRHRLPSEFRTHDRGPTAERVVQRRDCHLRRGNGAVARHDL